MVYADLPELQGRQHGLKVVAQQPEQAVGRSVEQQPELVGQEPVATQAIGFKLQLQLFDPVFYVAPEQRLGGEFETGPGAFSLISPGHLPAFSLTRFQAVERLRRKSSTIRASSGLSTSRVSPSVSTT